MDLTSLWVHWARYRNFGGLAIVAIAIFGTGWQLGRVMSPYYAAHPIIFQENQAAGGVSANGSEQELLALREAGVALRSNAPEPSISVAPAVAGAATASATAPDKLYVGSVNSDKYHHRDCPSARQIKEENQVWFGSIEEAEKAGYVPSQCTLEKAAAVPKPL